VGERHIEHREEVGRRVARVGVERVQVGAGRLDRDVAARHHRLAIAALGAQERLGVEPADLEVRLLARRVALLAGRVELDVEELVALVRQRVSRQEVQHGEGGHAGPDAERDRQHHEAGQHPVAAEAPQREVDVVEVAGQHRITRPARGSGGSGAA
jgi:hypothetical protein